MKRRAHYFQHVDFESPGYLLQWLAQNDWSTENTRFDLPNPTFPSLENFDFLIVMGGPMGVSDEAEHPWLREEKRFIQQAIEKGKHTLGICLGAQLIASVLGAEVRPNAHKEIGWHPIGWTPQSLALPMLSGFNEMMTVFHWHGDTFTLPKGATHLASSQHCAQQAFLYQQHVLALQFHLEIEEQGAKALIKRCAHELKPAPAIQTAQQMLDSPDRFPRSHSYLAKLLDQWL